MDAFAMGIATVIVLARTAIPHIPTVNFWALIPMVFLPKIRYIEYMLTEEVAFIKE
jgi:hypothetical protein